MATQMTNAVPGIVTFRSPVFLQVRRGEDNINKGNQLLTAVAAVKGVWTTNATGTDGKITVTDVLPVNEENLVTLRQPVVLDTLSASNAPNIVALQ